MIRKINYKFAVAALALCLTACSGEDELEPSHADEILFYVPEDAEGPEANLRREFYKETGVHLLFNDTLSVTHVGEDGFGDDVYDMEIVDFNYSQTTVADAEYRMTYYTDAKEQAKAVEILKKYIYPHIGDNLRPYSILLVNTFEAYEYNSSEWYTDWWQYDMRMGWRCTAFALGDLSDDMDEENVVELANRIISSLVKGCIERKRSEIPVYWDFFDFSDEYYYAYKEDLGLPEEYDDDQARQFGFLKDYRLYDYINSNKDFDYYVDEVLALSEEEFVETYGDYPLIMSKYEVMRKILNSIGYIK